MRCAIWTSRLAFLPISCKGLPEQMKGSLPTIEELEAELGAVSGETESEA